MLLFILTKFACLILCSNCRARAAVTWKIRCCAIKPRCTHFTKLTHVAITAFTKLSCIVTASKTSPPARLCSMKITSAC